jgi:YwiC-like protein
MSQQAISIRAVALPAEHGGWALILEPIVLGLLVAPSRAGLYISAGAFACFLARHPIKLAIGDRRKPHVLKRTSFADRFAMLYVMLAVVFFAFVVANTNKDSLLPLVVAVPLVLVQLIYDGLGLSRKLMPEIAGALAVGSISTAIALAGGWPRATAYALWIIVACRHVPTIVYLRVLLSRRRRRQQVPVHGPVIAVQLLALLAVLILFSFKIAPALAVVVFVILFVRAVIGLFNEAALTPKKLGISEIVFGAFAVLTIGAGYWFGW